MRRDRCYVCGILRLSKTDLYFYSMLSHPVESIEIGFAVMTCSTPDKVSLLDIIVTLDSWVG